LNAYYTRYALATYGERDLGFRPGEGGIILDHLEGVEPNDVTGQFYSSDPQIARKRQMMRAWVDWCDEWTAKAVAEDRAPRDAELMGAEIRARCYKTRTPA
jgi:glutathione S-transferase